MPDYDAWANSIRTRDWQDSGERWDFRLQTAISQFYAREISDDVFRALLYALQFRGQILACEFRYHEQERHDREKKR